MLALASAGGALTPQTATRQLNDGNQMPVVGLGTWKAKADDVERAVFHAICKAGYRHIDAAQIYLNQEQVGAGLKAAESCGVRRQDLWITSKLWMTDFHPRDLPAAVDRILGELGTDYVDQLLLHWPLPYGKPPPGCPADCPQRFAGTDDPMRPRDSEGRLVNGDTPLRDTWQALVGARDAGKVRSVGVSNFSPAEIAQLSFGPGSPPPAVNQVEAHVFWHQPTLRKAMRELDIAVVAYTPLGNPAIYGDRLEGMASSLITEMAAETGLTPAQVMLSFLLQQDIIVVPKSVTPERIDSNINFQPNLSTSQLERLSAGAPQRRLANPKNRPGGKPVFDDTGLPHGSEL